MKMVHITIDGRKAAVEPDTPVIIAARQAGVVIPAMCYMEELDHFTSCMVCMVKDADTGKLFPSCSLKVTEGMNIITGDEEVMESRKTALELLLSEHVGDCEAPCQVTCPAHMDIPLMNRLLASGEFDEALRVVKRDIALPSVLGRICPAPCEGACRRRSVDQAVSICLLKRYAGDQDLFKKEQYLPAKENSRNKKIAIIGAGPAGLAAAWYLQIRGYDCVIFDRNKKAGGSILKETTGDILPPEILEREISIIENYGVRINLGEEIDTEGFEMLLKSTDAVILASGKENSLASDAPNLFVTGSARKPSKLAIRALGEGKETAFSVDQFLRGDPVTGETRVFNSRFGKLLPEELAEYLKESVAGNRIEPRNLSEGLTGEEVMAEAARCMHCDCRDLEKCKLRLYADRYSAVQKRFMMGERLPVTKHFQHDTVVYEPAKCIKCGICVRMTSKYREDYGMTFIGRGFDVVVGIPFNETLARGLSKIAIEVADACPTGAISKK